MSNSLMAQELTTYLLCPQKYEFEYVAELTSDTRRNQDRFRQLLRKAICTGYSDVRSNGTDTRDAAVEALTATWGSYADAVDHHSSQQESTEEIRARAGIEAYFDVVGTTHLGRIEQAAEGCGEPVVGPDITWRHEEKRECRSVVRRMPLPCTSVSARTRPTRSVGRVSRTRRTGVLSGC